MENKYKIRFLLSALLLITMLFSFAQADTIPNHGFETWTGSGSNYNATYWGDLNSSTGILGVYTVQRATVANAHSGSYAMELYSQTVPVVNEIAPGITATTSINTSTQQIQGGFPMNYRPYKFQGWFKYAPVSPDTFSAQVLFFSGTTTGPVIGSATFTASAAAGSYTWFSVLVNYTSAAIPDSAQILLLSSSSSAPQNGSKAYVDDLDFVNCTTMAVSATPTASTCALNNGSAVAMASGGAGPYTYLWSTSDTSGTISNITPATYTVVATDTNGCSASATALVDSANVPFTVNTTVTPSCGHTNGQALATVSGGASPYTYLWSNTDTTDTINSLTTAIYNVTVTDHNGCTSFASANVGSANVPFMVTSTPSPASCNTASGAVLATASGGNQPYAYFWSNTDTAHNITVVAGTYSVTVTDAHGCTSTASSNVSSVNVPFTVIATPTSTSCVSNTGTVIASASAGNQPYTYLWANTDTALQLTNLGPGNYDVTVTDAHGCTSTASATVTTPGGPSAIDTIKNVTCYGDTNGAVTISVTGGTNPIHYAWNNTDTTKNLNAVVAGNYTLTITDANNCSFQLSANVLQPGILYTSAIIGNVSCYGYENGDIAVTAYGGTLPYSYTWSDSAGIPQPGQGLPPGSYNLTVTDNNNCSVASLYIVTQPAQLLATSLVQNIACFGQATGSITVDVTGGTMPYRFLWNDFVMDSIRTNIPGGIYSLTIADSNGCNIVLTDTVTSPAADLTASPFSTNVLCFDSSTGSVTAIVNGGTTPYHYLWNNNDTTASLSNIVAGSYSLTITDANNCTAYLPVVITQPAASLTVTVSVTNASSQTADDGSATISLTGGTPPYTVNWITGSNSDTITHLQADTYSVTITDSVGCSVATYAIVGITTGINTINTPLVKIYPNPANTQVTIQTGVDSKYTFSIYSTDGQVVSQVSLSGSKTSVDLQGLSAGFYTFGLRDLNTGGIQYGKLEIQR